MKSRPGAAEETILIRTSDDYRVLNCIASIKRSSPSSEIVVSMTPNIRLEKLIRKMGIRYCIVPKKNVSVTTNRGLDLVKTSKVIVTDCDTIFENNCIQLLNEGLDNVDVVKPRLIYQSDNSLLSQEVANLRTFFNDTNKMYMPGLSFKLSLKSKIGNYIFNEKIAWSEDSEFSDRLGANRIKTSYQKNALLIHSSTSVVHDLADAFLIGAKKNRVEKLKDLTKKRLDVYHKVYKSFGITTLIYTIAWYSFFDIGQFSKKLGIIGKLLEGVCWKVINRAKNRR